MRVNQVVGLRPQLLTHLADAAKVIPLGFPTVDKENVKLNAEGTERLHLRLHEAAETRISFGGPQVGDNQDPMLGRRHRISFQFARTLAQCDDLGSNCEERW